MKVREIVEFLKINLYNNVYILTLEINFSVSNIVLIYL